jgi:hypothetical protein
MSTELQCALQVSKFSARECFGVIRKLPSGVELLKLLNEQMILQVLSDASCLEELTDIEVTTLTNILTLHVQ